MIREYLSPLVSSAFHFIIIVLCDPNSALWIFFFCHPLGWFVDQSCFPYVVGSKVDPLVLLWLNQTRDDDTGPGQRVKRRRRTDHRSDIDIKKIVKDLLTPHAPAKRASSGAGEESSPEVSSSNISPEPSHPVVTTTSPVPSDIDLDFWDLDINESSNANTVASASGNEKQTNELLLILYAWFFPMIKNRWIYKSLVIIKTSSKTLSDKNVLPYFLKLKSRSLVFPHFFLYMFACLAHLSLRK